MEAGEAEQRQRQTCRQHEEERARGVGMTRKQWQVAPAMAREKRNQRRPTATEDDDAADDDDKRCSLHGAFLT